MRRSAAVIVSSITEAVIGFGAAGDLGTHPMGAQMAISPGRLSQPCRTVLRGPGSGDHPGAAGSDGDDRGTQGAGHLTRRRA